MADLSNLGKKAEGKVKEWLDRPEEGYWCFRLKDQMTGMKGSCNPCDFLLYKKPYNYLIESKSTYENRFDYSMITDYQHDEMIKASKVEGIKSYVVVLFASYGRAFLLDINDIEKEIKARRKSINIKRVQSWKIPYVEIRTIPSRKTLLDYDKAQADEIFK